ncbi:hypothetical protein [Cryptosporangium minutisporangium]|uniref:hypothetical protein n=1 Tax=Cryptosporangium minutisporangium TaxID=113569 RepID=UPI0031ECA800
MLALVGQAFAGHAVCNGDQPTSGLPGASLGRYVTSAPLATEPSAGADSSIAAQLCGAHAVAWRKSARCLATASGCSRCRK